MPLTPDRIETLRAYDLSDYAARAYLALLELGETEARDVSRLANIPVAKVYAVLDGLQARGLCEVRLQNPKKYAPVPFEVFLDALVLEHARASEAITRQRDALKSRFAITGKASMDDRGRFHVVSGRKSSLDKEKALLDAARSEVLMFCTPGRLLRLRAIFGELEGAHARGVKLRLMIPRTPTWEEDRSHFSAIAEVKLRAYPESARAQSVAYVVCDRDTVYFVDHVPDDESLRAGHDAGIHIAQQGLVAGLSDSLYALWDAAAAVPTPDVAERRRPSTLKRG